MILVFGATGYIGRYLCPYLVERGHDVLALGRSEKVARFFRNKGIKFRRFDYLKEEPFKDFEVGENIDAIIDLATILPEIAGIDIEDVFKVNAIGVYKTLEWANSIGVKKVIVTSTHKTTNACDKPLIGPYDIKYGGGHSPYIISKLAAEGFVEYFNKEYGMQGVVLRLTGVHGYGELMGTVYPDGSYSMSTTERFIGQALIGETIEVWGDEIKRDHVYIKDVIQVIELAIKSDKAKGNYFVSNGVAYSLYDEAKAIVDIFSPKEHRSEIVLRKDKTGLDRGYKYDISSTVRDLGYKPQYTDLRVMYEDYKMEWEKKEYHHYHYIKPSDRPATCNV